MEYLIIGIWMPVEVMVMVIQISEDASPMPHLRFHDDWWEDDTSGALILEKGNSLMDNNNLLLDLQDFYLQKCGCCDIFIWDVILKWG